MKLILLFAIVGIVAFLVYMFVLKEKASDDNDSDTEEIIFPGYDKGSVLPVTLEQSGKREETIDTIIVNNNDNSNLLTFILDFTLPESTYIRTKFSIEKAVGSSPNNYVRIQKHGQTFLFDYFKDGSVLFSIRSNHNSSGTLNEMWALWADDQYNSDIAALTGHLRMEIRIPRVYEHDSHIDVNITHVDTNTTYTYTEEAPDKKVILQLPSYSPSHYLNYTLDEVPYTIHMTGETIEVHELKIIT